MFHESFFLLINIIILSVSSFEIPSEQHQVIYDKFIEDGLHTLQNVADELVQFVDDTDHHHSQMEHHLKRRLFYHPDLKNDHVKEMTEEQLDYEAEKIVHNVVYHMYDTWDHLMEPVRDAFAPYEHFITALTTNLNYVDPKTQAKLKIKPPANETVIDMVNGLKKFPEVLRRVDRMMQQTLQKMANDDLQHIDYATVQRKVFDKLKQAGERYQFV